MGMICKIKWDIIETGLLKETHCIYYKLLKVKNEDWKIFYFKAKFLKQNCKWDLLLEERLDISNKNYFLVDKLNNDILSFSDKKFPESYLFWKPIDVDLNNISDCKLSHWYNFYFFITISILLILLVWIFVFKKIKRS